MVVAMMGAGERSASCPGGLRAGAREGEGGPHGGGCGGAAAAGEKEDAPAGRIEGGRASGGALLHRDVGVRPVRAQNIPHVDAHTRDAAGLAPSAGLVR